MSDTPVRYRKSPYHEVYRSHVQAAIGRCRAIAPVQHAGEKGRMREVLLRDLFRPLLPADVGVGTGLVITASGDQSTQQDIVIYDRATLPPALIDDNTGLFPIESVIRVVEVKSTLTHKELETSHEAAKWLAGLPLHGKGGRPVRVGPRPGYSVFALDSDLSLQGKSEVDRYHAVRNQDGVYVMSLCVVNRGYWWFTDPGFNEWPDCRDYHEVLGFLTGLLNDLPEQYEARRSARPPLGAYLADFGRDLEAEVNALVVLQMEIKGRLSKGIIERHLAVQLRDRYQAQVAQMDEAVKQYKGEGYRKLYQMVHAESDPLLKVLTDLAEGKPSTEDRSS